MTICRNLKYLKYFFFPLENCVYMAHYIYMCVLLSQRHKKIFYSWGPITVRNLFEEGGKRPQRQAKNTSYLTIQHCWAMWKTPSVLFSHTLKTLKSNISWFLLSYPHRGLKKNLSQTCWELIFFFSVISLLVKTLCIRSCRSVYLMCCLLYMSKPLYWFSW